MSFMGNMTGNKALTAHSKGDYRTALKLYEEAYEKGMDKPRLLRGYSVLLIRTSQFDKALEVLKRMEKMPMDAKEKTDLHINYAIILWQKGHLDRAMEILEDEFRHTKNGTLYSIIGYLKIEQGDAEEAIRFNKEALEYDDEDPVFLDNLGQTYYRLVGDKETAKIYFDKAIALKPKAIDTNYFLALYDIENGDIESAKDRLDTARVGMFSPLNYATPEMIDAKRDELRNL
ncbi:MAG: tetratricopeptide repeat protein [Clostridiales bacterium]|nr:tetratricopeptide repeat protein [Clostridiales bacterium]MDY3763975.1 tetratricopeptide repeat protein [Candidatus Ventricola sp.]MCI6587770.1 tetratricopeptide repeat protein [Clostridiales bacterium]MCI7705137.1 tetratricopeptide repeat protein [Clostridiales bacterium]MDY3832730.1 tetratricopeptide repeat protein [Candidatus Ventricola sp.]